MFRELCCFHVADDFVAVALLTVCAEKYNRRRTENAEALEQSLVDSSLP